MPAPRLLIAGATGALGNEVMRRLVGGGRWRETDVLARESMRTGLPGVHLVQPELHPHAHPDAAHPGAAIAHWRPLAALAPEVDTAVVMFDPPRLHYDRERALYTPTPEALPALARWLHEGGVRTLAVVLPHSQGRLPAALRQGLASLDEQAVASLGFERVLLVRSAQKPAALARGSAPQRLAHWMLSVVHFMVPVSEQPVRAAKVAEFVALALQLAPRGVHVAGPDVVWQAGQGDLPGVVRRWLGANGSRTPDEPTRLESAAESTG